MAAFRASLPDGAPAAPATASEVAGGVASVVWIVGSLIWFVVAPPVAGSGSALAVLLGLNVAALPVMALWGVLGLLRLNRVIRDEADRLHAAIEAQWVTPNQTPSAPEARTDPVVREGLADLRAAQRRIEAALSSPTPRETPPPAPTPSPATPPERPVPDPDPAPAEAPTGQEDLPFEQEDLPFDQSEEAPPPPLPSADFIRALNFPDNPEDTEGFEALRRALRDRPTAQLVRAAQDVLTLMSQDGLYMDDYPPEPAPPDLWRRFAAGERGHAIAAIGGVRDRAALAEVSVRMKRDPIFRDAAHHFMRLFDRTVAQFAEGAWDEEIAVLAKTRTARAFMLLGRSAGTFD